MADKEFFNYRTPCTDVDDEIEGLNERLLQLLRAQRVSSPDAAANKSQSSCNSRLGNNSDSKVEVETSASPLFSHCRYDCSFMHHDSPVNIPTVPNYLPPIGVFWDIENCQVGLQIPFLSCCMSEKDAVKVILQYLVTICYRFLRADPP